MTADDKPRLTLRERRELAKNAPPPDGSGWPAAPPVPKRPRDPMAGLPAMRNYEQEAADGAHEPEGDAAKKSQATQLVEMALEQFDLGVTEAGEAFAVLRDGPNVALPFRGGRSSLGAALARAFYDRHGKAATAAARADALTVLEGQAADLDPVEPALRVGRDGRDRVVVDLGTADGSAVMLHRGRFEVLRTSPLLFRRTNLTVPLPHPGDGRDGQGLRILRDCGMNMAEREWRLLVGFLVASVIPEIPHPVLALFGEQGTGKSTAGRLIGSVLDPSSAPLRTSPRNEEQWAIQAAGSWVVVLDNVSSVQPWLSDALCRAVTGDGYVRRTLYSNSDVSVLSFRRVIVMTSIDAGAMRGDLAERLLPIELHRIDPSNRRTEADILDQFNRHHSDILAGLFTLAAQVLEVLPGVRLDVMPRMADFARVLAALDDVMGWDTLAGFAGIGDDLAHDVVAADPVACAVVEMMSGRETWTGQAGQLLAALTTDERSRLKAWPRSPVAMTGALKRAAVALRSVGIDADLSDQRSRSGRAWTITRCEERRNPPSPPTPPSPTAPLQASSGDGHEVRPSPPTSRPSPSDPNDRKAGDGGDGRDGQLHLSSHAVTDGNLCINCGENPAGSFSGGICVSCSADAAEATT